MCTMRNILKLLVILSASIVKSSDEFLTIWTPDVINSGEEYNIPFLTSEIDERTKISVQICNSYATTQLASEKLQYIIFGPNSQKTISNATEIYVTLNREEENNSITRQMCLSQTINHVKIVQKNFYTFIQTDKPIYLPGDDVKFQIIVVDNNLVPYDVQNIQINFIDPKGRLIQEINDDGTGVYTVYTGSFRLSKSTSLGVWRVKVIVDKQLQLVKVKKFGVTKLKIPKITAHIVTNSDYFLTVSTAQFSIYAQNSVGNFVHGNAKLTIKCITQNEEVLSKTFTNITGITNANFKIADELKANTTTKLDYEATVVFTEAESGINSSETAKFSVYADFYNKIKVQHLDFFIPGLPFEIKILVMKWNEELYRSSVERITISLDCELENETHNSIRIDSSLKHGVAVVNQIIPQHTEKLNINVKFQNTRYYKQIKAMGTIGGNKLTVDYSPKFPNRGDHVIVYIKADTEIDKIIIIISSKNGQHDSDQIYCFFKKICKFEFILLRRQMPEAKVSVYRVQNLTNIDEGEVTIISNEIGVNFLDIEMTKSWKSEKTIEIEVTTKPESTVYLIGYDKRLTKYFHGNEVNKDDVIKELANYDKANRVTAFDMSPINWYECSDQELQKIQKGIRDVIRQTDWGYPGVEFEDEAVCIDDEKPEESQKLNDFDPTELNDITEDFHHVWLFESFKVPYGKLTKSITIPDSMTDLVLSSFSVNINDGIAFGKRQEMTVKSEFYIRSLMPNKIKIGEIFQAKIMVYNYGRANKEIDVTLRIDLIDKDLNIKFYESECNSMPNNETTMTKMIKVPYGNAKIVSFYIQTLPEETNMAKTINILVSASETNRSYVKYEERIKRIRIKVEPLGAETVKVMSKNYSLSPKKGEIIDSIKERVVSKDEFERYFIGIECNFLTENVRNEYLSDYMYRSYFLDQQTYMLKEEVEKFRFYKMKNTNLLKSGISKIYQSILSQHDENWNYKNTSGYKAVFTDTIASAMDVEALPKDIKMIEKEFDVLKELQNENGSFDNFGNILDVQENSSSAEYFQTAFILIPFLKFRGFVSKSYDEVIEKGLNFLNKTRNSEDLNLEAQSVAAYAYALNGDKNQTLEILNKVEKQSNQFEKDQKCYKLSANHSSCNLRLTAYSTLAYLTINQTVSIQNCVNYLLSQHQLKSYHGTNFNHAITVEAISKFLITNSDNNLTDLKVKFTSERGIEKILNINNSNENIRHKFIFPDKTLHPLLSMSGTGTCLVRKYIKSKVTVERQNSKINATATPLPVLVQNERIVRVCADYQQEGNFTDSQSFFLVIYDVELPSGYIFEEIMNLSSIPENKFSASKLSESRVQVYLNDFKEETNYCIDIKAIKAYEVKNIQNASVKVFDYNDIENASILFYTFKSDDWKCSIECISNSTTEAS